MRRWRAVFLFLFCFLLAGQPVRFGPPRGALVVVGGGAMGPEILARFMQLAGGADAPVVIIPTADSRDQFDEGWAAKTPLAKAGMKNLIVLHTRSREMADSEQFVAPLKKTGGVWFTGGRQWRLVDSYLNTRTQRELAALLVRGGVIGGTSAGATIQGSYLVRGAREGNQIMMAPGYEEGMGFLRSAAIDQHLLARHREKDLIPVVDAHPELLGIGIDESTAIVVQRDRFEVIGASKVGVYRKGQPVLFLAPGAVYDLARRAVLDPAHQQQQQ